MNKYNAMRTEIDGIVFHSKREASRYAELKLLQQAGTIDGLKLQVNMPVKINGKHICRYMADFHYTEGGKLVVEDVKGYRTPVYKLKKKMVEAFYDCKILET
jgi:hypothetical protein